MGECNQRKKFIRAVAMTLSVRPIEKLLINALGKRGNVLRHLVDNRFEKWLQGSLSVAATNLLFDVSKPHHDHNHNHRRSSHSIGIRLIQVQCII
jgi:hypothetical protein